MIKSNQGLLNRIHVLLDALTIVAAYVAAWEIRFESGLFQVALWHMSLADCMKALVIVLPGYLFLYYIFQLYTPKRVQGRRLEALHIVQANTIGVMAFTLILYLVNEPRFPRLMIAIFYGLNVFLCILYRNIIRAFLMHIRRKGYNQKHILLVGYSRACEEYIDRVIAHPSWGYTIHGILADNAPRGMTYRGYKVLGATENLTIILPENKLDEIVITLGLAEYHKLEHIVSMCEKSGVHTKFVPDYNNILPTRPYTEDLVGLPVVNIRRVPLSDWHYALIKRFFDIVGSLVAIVIFSPVMLFTAIAIKLSSSGPVIYKQERIGKQNRPFDMYKFRSMVVQDEDDEKKQWTTKNDDRVTGIGHFIRKTSIDEMPQFFNVLKGDMSLIGPRPERPQFVEQFKEEIPRYMVKHQVRPGLTGWAQVNGLRGDTSIKKRIEYDLYYIENWTIGLDIKILVLTFFKGFVNKNAY